MACGSAIIDYAINSLHCDFVKFGTLYEMAGEGGTPATSNAAYYDNGNIPFIKIDDLKQKYLTENKDFITELGLQNHQHGLYLHILSYFQMVRPLEKFQ